MNKQQIMTGLRAFCAQRSGIDPRNYGSLESLMGDYDPILRHGRHARAMLAFIGPRDLITADQLVEASKKAFSGRLSIVEKDGKVIIDYCAGQYFAVEYRKALCAVLAHAIGKYLTAHRSNEPYPKRAEFLRKAASREFGRGIANEWFQP